MRRSADGNAHRMARPSPCPPARAQAVEIFVAGTAKVVDAGYVDILLKIRITISLNRGGVTIDYFFQVAVIAVVVGVVAAQTFKHFQGTAAGGS